MACETSRESFDEDDELDDDEDEELDDDEDEELDDDEDEELDDDDDDDEEEEDEDEDDEDDEDEDLDDDEEEDEDDELEEAEELDEDDELDALAEYTGDTRRLRPSKCKWYKRIAVQNDADGNRSWPAGLDAAAVRRRLCKAFDGAYHALREMLEDIREVMGHKRYKDRVRTWNRRVFAKYFGKDPSRARLRRVRRRLRRMFHRIRRKNFTAVLVHGTARAVCKGTKTRATSIPGISKIYICESFLASDSDDLYNAHTIVHEVAHIVGMLVHQTDSTNNNIRVVKKALKGSFRDKAARDPEAYGWLAAEYLVRMGWDDSGKRMKS